MGVAHLNETRPARIAGAWLLATSLLWCTSGCGRGTGTVSGTVIFNGRPLPGGVVTFVSEQKQSVSAMIQEDGSYEITKMPAGPVKICVDTESLNPVMKPPPEAGMRREQGIIMPGGIRPGQVPPEMRLPEEPPSPMGKYVKIPKKFTDPEQSGLTYVVQRGKQVHDIQLK